MTLRREANNIPLSCLASVPIKTLVREWHWKMLAPIQESNRVVGFRLGEEASHCLSAASFGLRANAAAHGQAKIFHSLDLFGHFLHQGKK